MGVAQGADGAGHGRACGCRAPCWSACRLTHVPETRSFAPGSPRPRPVHSQRLPHRPAQEALAVSPARQYPLFKQTMWHAALYWSEVLRRTAGVSRRKRDALAAQLPSPGRGVRESGSTEAWTAGEQVGARERLPSRRKVSMVAFCTGTAALMGGRRWGAVGFGDLGARGRAMARA